MGVGVRVCVRVVEGQGEEVGEAPPKGEALPPPCVAVPVMVTEEDRDTVEVGEKVGERVEEREALRVWEVEGERVIEGEGLGVPLSFPGLGVGSNTVEEPEREGERE